MGFSTLRRLCWGPEPPAHESLGWEIYTQSITTPQERFGAALPAHNLYLPIQNVSLHANRLPTTTPPHPLG